MESGTGGERLRLFLAFGCGAAAAAAAVALVHRHGLSVFATRQLETDQAPLALGSPWLHRRRRVRLVCRRAQKNMVIAPNDSLARCL